MRGRFLRYVRWFTAGLLASGPVFASTLTAVTTSDFGTVSIGSTAQLTFRLTAVGGTITVTSATVSAAPFSKISDACTGNTGMSATATCDIVVQYTPTAAAFSSGTLTVVIAGGGAATGTQKIVSFSGIGSSGSSSTITASMTVTSGSSDYGSKQIGSSTSATFTLTNDVASTASLTITSATTAAPFTKTEDNCTGRSIAANSTCTIKVNYVPTATTASVGVLTVVTNATNGTNLISSLTGTGLAAAPNAVLASLSDSSYTYPNTAIASSKTKTFTLSWSGNTGTFSVTSATTAGATFSKISDQCTGLSDTAVSGSCAVVVQFTPTAQTTTVGTLTIITSASPTTLIASLQGTGADNNTATASISPASYDFGSVDVGKSASKTFTITNTGGNLPVIITSVTVPASASTSAPPSSFFVSADNCTSTTLAATDDSCTFTIQYIPTTSGAFAGTVVVVTNASDGVNKIAALNGTSGITVAGSGGGCSSTKPSVFGIFATVLMFFSLKTLRFWRKS